MRKQPNWLRTDKTRSSVSGGPHTAAKTVGTNGDKSPKMRHIHLPATFYLQIFPTYITTPSIVLLLVGGFQFYLNNFFFFF